MDCHRKDFEFAEELGVKGGVGRAHGNMGNIYYSIGRYQKTIDCHRIALEIAEELGDRSGIGRGHGNIGNAYHDIGEYKEAMDFHLLPEFCSSILA